MSNEIRVHGPPGTGKTQKLAEEIVPTLADKYGTDKVMLTSFTKAAAQELGQRIDLGESKITGTLHSICFHALGKPTLTQDKIKEWNNSNSLYRLDGDSKDAGPQCHTKYQVLRNKLIPRTQWPQEVENFAIQWESWKQDANLMDFIDLIETAGQSYGPPGSPSAIVIDEAQDFTRMEMSVLRRWASQVQEFWVVGDEDQTLYSFSGADPRNMLLPELPQEQKIILDQSYRIPRQVHNIAERIIGRVRVREPKIYKPKPNEGSVEHREGNFNNPSWVIQKALSLPGETMILTSCNYMLGPVIKQLRDSGIAFANQWRPEEVSWNPLGSSGSDLLKNFLYEGPDAPYWDTGQFLEWATYIKVGPNGLIRKQGNEGLLALEKAFEEDPFEPGFETCRDYIDQIFSPDAIQPALGRNLNWLSENLVKAKATVVQYPMRVFQKHGLEALQAKPKITVGTIHSVKGAGADNVFIYPDVSSASSNEAQSREGYENLCRLFYVGVTRTKENLFIMSKASRHFFTI